MNAYPTFPAAPFGCVVRLIYRIVAFLALRACTCNLGKIPAVTAQTLARFVAPAARLLAWPCSFARQVRHARLKTQSVRHAGLLVLRMCGGDGGLLAGAAPSRIADGGARGAGVGARGWRVAAGRVPSNDGRTNGRGSEHRPLAVFRLIAPAGTTRTDCEIRSKTRNCAQISASVPRGRVADSKLALCPAVLSTGSDGGARASCEFSTGFRNWVTVLGAQ